GTRRVCSVPFLLSAFCAPAGNARENRAKRRIQGVRTLSSRWRFGQRCIAEYSVLSAHRMAEKLPAWSGLAKHGVPALVGEAFEVVKRGGMIGVRSKDEEGRLNLTSPRAGPTN